MRDKGKSGVSEKTHGGEVVRGDGDTDVSGVAVAAVLGTREEDWAVRNRRRISLIAKQFSQGLNPDEERELGQLQAEADRYLDEVAPLPFEHLQKLEERVHLHRSGWLWLLIAILRLDSPGRTLFRQRWLRLLRYLQGRSDEESASLLRWLLSFPEDLPNLAVLRPPGGNTRPAGVQESYFALRERGLLPDTY